jgi:thiosulfate dehydrogenase [quinone] large subunit
MATTHRENLSHDAPVGRGAFTHQEDVVRSEWARRFLGVMRYIIGFTFFWPFLDKLFGLGYATPSARAWINGGTPAQGFMKGVGKGDNPFGDFFANITGPWADWLFMLGLFGIGLAMILGAGVKLAAWAGALLMLFMYLALLPWYSAEPATNPVFDSHWIEGLVLIVVAATYSGDKWGLGKWWGNKVGDSIWR